MNNAGFYRVDGALTVDGIPLDKIAEEFGTPLYVYSAAAILAVYQQLAEAISDSGGKIHYALKANSNLAVLRLLAREGAGADIVSVGEFRRARAAGIAAKDIIFSGVGKTSEELHETIEAGIGQINAESPAEIETLIDIGRKTHIKPRVALRVNPDISAGGHVKIATGKREAKFGMDEMTALESWRRLASSDAATPVGLAVHIGSQIMDVSLLEAAWRQILALATKLEDQGFKVENFDLGGGIGVDSASGNTLDLAAFGKTIKALFAGRNRHLVIEPGRYLTAEAGCLLTRVISVKHNDKKRFIIVDGAMNDFLRPTLYEAWHRIETVADSNGAAMVKADIVGPICETGDYLGLDRDMAETIAAGDTLAVMSAGAYGAVMRSYYNTRAMAVEVMALDGIVHQVSRRRSLDEIIADDTIPPPLR